MAYVFWEMVQLSIRGYKKIGTKHVDARVLKEWNLNKSLYCLIYLKEAQSSSTDSSVALNKYCIGGQILSST